ncbi:MAG TPA: response regulator transcription factor [Oscillospiraceae bacterium]|nr:response regulator transcription factor [Oscillospiraceae bacterium]HNW04209.1 response regulator transcription factor [Oscillospiraceae bacterium]
MEQVHILLIEDDPKIVNFMSMALKAKNYKVTTAATGKQGVLAFCTQNPDILLLDLGLPDMDGNEIIREVRKVSEIPILIVSARGMDNDKVAALDLGANDYVTKPFSMTELLARIRVMERFIDRRDLTQPETVMQFGALTIDTERRRIFLGEEEVHLTPLEYKLLVLLAVNCGKVITHSQIMKEVWGYEETGDAKSIRVCMASLRRKIEADTANPQYIFTEVGVGYRFTDK